MDVTVFRGGPLEKWEDAKEHIREAIHSRVIKRNHCLNIDIQIALEPIKPDQVIKQALDGINASPTHGSVSVGTKGVIRWEPTPFIKMENASSLPDLPASSFAAAFGMPTDKMSNIVASQATLTLPTSEDREKINQLLFKTLCNKLKEKRDQFPSNKPAFYVTKIGHRGVTVENMLSTLQEHIWRKDDYRWISGIILFTPKQGFHPSDGGQRRLYNSLWKWQNPKN